MYDPPELHREVDAWWAALASAFRAEGITDVPDRLDRNTSFDALWRSPDLLFAQACGYPLMIGWAEHLRYLATPLYDAPGCHGSSYCSWLVVPANSRFRTLEELRGATCSINGRNSHSGYNALRAHIAPLARDGRFFGAVCVSGGHSQSLVQLASGEADVAAIDCVTYELLRRCRPDAIAAVRIVSQTAPAPGLPYVTRRGATDELCRRLWAGLERAFADARLASVRAALLIAGIERLPVADYAHMVRLQAVALDCGYAELG